MGSRVRAGIVNMEMTNAELSLPRAYELLAAKLTHYEPQL